MKTEDTIQAAVDAIVAVMIQQIVASINRVFDAMEQKQEQEQEA